MHDGASARYTGFRILLVMALKNTLQVLGSLWAEKGFGQCSRHNLVGKPGALPWLWACDEFILDLVHSARRDVRRAWTFECPSSLWRMGPLHMVDALGHGFL